MFVAGPDLKGLSWQTLTQTDSSKTGPEPSASAGSQINGGRQSISLQQDRRSGNGTC